MSPRTGTDFPGAEEWVPDEPTLPAIHEAAQGCRGCDLYRDATQAVTGSGDADAALMLLGEQPGDREDVAGEPFVGPAGKLLDRALADAGIEPEDTFVTNAVKHFRFERRGKQRIHKSPSRGHVLACAPWLSAELEVVRPRGVESFHTHQVPLDEAPNAYEIFQKKEDEAIKILFKPHG